MSLTHLSHNVSIKQSLKMPRDLKKNVFSFLEGKRLELCKHNGNKSNIPHLKRCKKLLFRLSDAQTYEDFQIIMWKKRGLNLDLIVFINLLFNSKNTTTVWLLSWTEKMINKFEEYISTNLQPWFKFSYIYDNYDWTEVINSFNVSNSSSKNWISGSVEEIIENDIKWNNSTRNDGNWEKLNPATEQQIINHKTEFSNVVEVELSFFEQSNFYALFTKLKFPIDGYKEDYFNYFWKLAENHNLDDLISWKENDFFHNFKKILDNNTPVWNVKMLFEWLWIEKSIIFISKLSYFWKYLIDWLRIEDRVKKIIDIFEKLYNDDSQKFKELNSKVIKWLIESNDSTIIISLLSNIISDLNRVFIKFDWELLDKLLILSNRIKKDYFLVLLKKDHVSLRKLIMEHEIWYISDNIWNLLLD